jgi:uncharacterized membrane protein HdeD (DUF308 family)
METKRFKNWWFLALNGIIFLLFGLLLIFNTVDFIKTLVMYIGFVFLGAGIVTVVIGFNKISKDKSAAVIIFESIISIAIGLLLIFFPQKSWELFMILIGVWFLVIGVIQLVFFVNAKGLIANKNGLLINSLLTIALGILLFFNPLEWSSFFGKIIGVLAAAFGVMLIYFSLLFRAARIPDMNPEPKKDE